MFPRNTISRGWQIPKVFNREEFLCLPAGAEEFQRLLQRHPQGLDRHPAGRVRECPLRHRGKRRAPQGLLLLGWQGWDRAVPSAGVGRVSSVCVQVFGKPEYLKYQDALNELANM